MKVVILGAGNIATYFCHALQNTPVAILQVYNRSIDDAKALCEPLHIPFTDKIENINLKADAYIFCVNDNAIPELSSKIDLKDKLAVHCAGSQSLDIFKNQQENAAVIWPIYSINKAHLPEHKNVPLIVEGSNPEALSLAMKIAQNISNNVTAVDFQQRLLLHLNAVIVNNFTNHLLAISETICKNNGLQFDILLPIITQTFHQLQNNKPSETQTGPAIRKDETTMQTHLKLLESHPQWQDAYKAISASIIKMHS